MNIERSKIQAELDLLNRYDVEFSIHVKRAVIILDAALKTSSLSEFMIAVKSPSALDFFHAGVKGYGLQVLSGFDLIGRVFKLPGFWYYSDALLFRQTAQVPLDSHESISIYAIESLLLKHSKLLVE